MSDIEDAVKFICEALKIANPTNCFIAHISDDFLFCIWRKVHKLSLS